MNLDFEKKGSWWVAEFEATDDFNLHIERAGGGNIAIYQTSVPSTKFDYVRTLNQGINDDVVDTAIIVPIPPMTIKIESKSMPTLAVATFRS